MKTKYLLLLGILLSTSVWACQNYEDCMAAPESYDVELFQAMSLKAIAYKLDEISKKMDKTDAPKCAPQD